MSPFDKSIIYKNIHWLDFDLRRLSMNLSNTPRICFKSIHDDIMLHKSRNMYTKCTFSW